MKTLKHCRALIVFKIIIILLVVSESQSFSLSPETITLNNLTLFGDAFFISKNNNHSLSLTQELPSCRSLSSSPTTTTLFFPFRNNGVGRVLYARPIHFLDSSTNTTTSFSSTFTFSIVPSPLCPAADGLAFLISTAGADPLSAAADPFAAAKGLMGLPDPKDSFFAIEFDTDLDPILGDLSNNHIGVDLSSAVSVAAADVAVDLDGGREVTAWVEYRALLRLVRVWVGYDPEARPASPALVARIDLSPILAGEFVYAGFSGSNGHGSALHVITRWKFGTFRSDGVGEKNEHCFICSEARTDSTSAVVNDKHKTRVGSSNSRLWGELVVGVGGLIAFVVTVLAIACIISYVVVKRRIARRRDRIENRALRGRGKRPAPTRLSMAEIRAATMEFDRGRIVGQGGSATVYKGSLPSGDVAVKRFLNGVSCLSSNHPFANEFATVVGCLRHKNLLQLRGWCCEGTELVLVYEYMPNGSLDKNLINLQWKERRNVVLGIASALTYLHEECERTIIHRDVKTSNIMLDVDLTP